MNIFILDPGLRELTGHHYDFVRKINSYLTSKGHTVKIFSHINTTNDILTKFKNIFPIFRSFPYPQFDGEILDYHQHSQLIQEDLQKVPDADYWIWPSTFSFQVNGYRMSDRLVKSAGCIHVEYDYHHVVYGKAQWTHSLADNFKLFAMEQKLVDDYIGIGVPCDYVPNPADNVPLDAPKQQLSTIGFFGHQRVDKGAKNILLLVDELIKEYDVILHDSSGTVKYIHPRVTCYSSVPELAEIIQQCDLVVLPYDRVKYKKMSSGILCEAMSIGIPCVVPSNTTLSDWVNITGAGVVFADEVSEAIHLADKNYQSIAVKAHKNAHSWAENYGVEKFINTLLEYRN